MPPACTPYNGRRPFPGTLSVGFSNSTMYLHLVFFWIVAQLTAASSSEKSSAGDPPEDAQLGSSVLTLKFYGESQCPFCRKFVTEAWPAVWEDPDLMQYIDYDFIAWGNAYFATEACGKGPYNPQQRACWYQTCQPPSSDKEDECFGEEVVYQHSAKEGEVDIYEMCVKLHAGLDAAVEFTNCCEGDKMDDNSMTSQALMKECLPTSVSPAVIENCFERQGHSIEVSAAKQTPDHPGVPYVLVDGESVDNPMAIKDEICHRLRALNVDLPKSCGSTIEDNSFATLE